MAHYYLLTVDAARQTGRINYGQVRDEQVDGRVVRWTEHKATR